LGRELPFEEVVAKGRLAHFDINTLVRIKSSGCFPTGQALMETPVSDSKAAFFSFADGALQGELYFIWAYERELNQRARAAGSEQLAD
jgi:hypothetical protein